MLFVSDFYQIMTDLVMHLPFAALRILYAKIVFKRVGCGVNISRHVHFMSPHRIELGNNVFINRNATLDGRLGLKIEDNVDIGEFVSIWSLQHDPNDPNHHSKGGTTVIKDHAWIAPHSIILPGLTVGRGSVIATMAVLTKSTGEKEIWAGIPAKQIGYRDNELKYKIEYKIFL